MVATDLKPLYCDCHVDVVMGYWLPRGQGVWYDKRHGQRHFKSVDVTKSDKHE